MRHRIAVLTAVLLVTLTACVKDPNAVPEPQAQPAVPAGSTVAQVTSSAPVAAPPTASAAPAGTGGTPRTGVTPTVAVKGTPVTNDISPTGFGPYGLGAGQAELASAGLIGPVRTDAQGCTRAAGVARWGSPALAFAKGGRLEHAVVTSGAIRTTRGVAVGSPIGTVKKEYPAGAELSGPAGTAWYLAAGDFALLFRFAGGKVTAIETGTSSTLSITFTGGPGC